MCPGCRLCAFFLLSPPKARIRHGPSLGLAQPDGNGGPTLQMLGREEGWKENLSCSSISLKPATTHQGGLGRCVSGVPLVLATTHPLLFRSWDVWQTSHSSGSSLPMPPDGSPQHILWLWGPGGITRVCLRGYTPPAGTWQV